MTLLSHRDYVRFWVADAVSMVGTYVTTLALQVLAVVTLRSSATGLGALNAARWRPDCSPKPTPGWSGPTRWRRPWDRCSPAGW